jgi:hypothetical protein
VSLINRSEILIVDEIEAVQPVEVTWQLHTPVEVEISDRTAWLTQNGDKLRMGVLQPEEAILEVQEVQIPPPQNLVKDIRKIKARLKI